MTLRELSRYYKLHRRLERNREMLTSLTASIGPGTQALTGMPHAPGVSDKIGGLAVELVALQEKIAALEDECAQERKTLETYLASIDDDQIRLIFRLRFFHCMTWPQVAKTIGGKNTAGGVKKICYRYLDTHVG